MDNGGPVMIPYVEKKESMSSSVKGIRQNIQCTKVLNLFEDTSEKGIIKNKGVDVYEVKLALKLKTSLKIHMKKKILTVCFAIIFCSGIAIFFIVVGTEKNLSGPEKDIRTAVKRSPDDYVSITRLGEIYWKTDRQPAALKEFRKALKINPDYAIPYYFLAENYFYRRKLELSRTNYVLFLEKMSLAEDLQDDLKMHYISVLHGIGQRFWVMKDNPGSLDVMERIIALDPNNLQARYNLAVYYYNREKDRIKAFQELKKVIEIDPKSRLAAKAEFFIDYMRRNPDPRIMGDFSFIDEN
jgi:hypothetical protein